MRTWQLQQTSDPVGSSSQIRARERLLEFVLQSRGHVLLDPLEAVGVAVGGVDEVELAGFLLVIVRVDNASHLHLQRLCEVSPKCLARRLSTYRPVELLHRRRARLLGGEVHRRGDRRALIGVRVVDLEALDRLEFSQIAVSFDRFLHGHSSHSATGPLAVRFQRVVWRVVVGHRLV